MAKQLGVATTMTCYAIFCFITFIYMYFKVKKTKGKSQEEIENLIC